MKINILYQMCINNIITATFELSIKFNFVWGKRFRETIRLLYCVDASLFNRSTVSLTEIVQQIRQAMMHIEQWAAANQSR